MNPNSPQMNQDQQNRLNAVMNTQTSSPTNPQMQQPPTPAPQGLNLNQTQSPPAPGTVGSIAPEPNPGLGMPNPPQQAQMASYQVPTVGMPTAPGLGTNAHPASPNAKKAKPKNKSGGGSPLLPILFVVGGVVFLLIYTVVWAVVFGLSIPFLPL